MMIWCRFLPALSHPLVWTSLRRREERELGLPGESCKECVAGEGGRNISWSAGDVHEKQVVDEEAAWCSIKQQSGLLQVGDNIKMGDSGKCRHPLQLAAQKGLADCQFFNNIFLITKSKVPDASNFVQDVKHGSDIEWDGTNKSYLVSKESISLRKQSRSY